MQLGEFTANTFAAVLALCALVIVFLVAGRPLFPRRQARMVIILPADSDTTAASHCRGRDGLRKLGVSLRSFRRSNFGKSTLFASKKKTDKAPKRKNWAGGKFRELANGQAAASRAKPTPPRRPHLPCNSR